MWSMQVAHKKATIGKTSAHSHSRATSHHHNCTLCCCFHVYTCPCSCSEVWLLQQLVDGGVFPNCGFDCWANKTALKPLLEMARQPATKGTLFLPGTKTAFQRQAEALCLTLDELLNAIAEDDGRAAMYVSAVFHPSRVLYSKDFKKDMPITTMQGLNFTLHQEPNRQGCGYTVCGGNSDVRL